MSRSFVRDVIKYLPSQVAPALVGLAAVPVLTRLFAPAAYGNYVLVVTTVSLLVTVVGWLGMSVIRFYPACERDGLLGPLHASVLAWLAISALGLAAVFLGTVSLARSSLGDPLYHLMLIGCVVFGLNAAFAVLQEFLRAKRWAGWYSVFFTWRSAAGFGIGLALVMAFGLGVEGLLWGSALAVGLALPFVWRLAVRNSPRKGRVSGRLTREMAMYSLPLVVSNAAAWVLSLSDRYIIELFRGSDEMGVYSASYSISETSILLLISLFWLASGPISVTIWENEGIEKSRNFVSSVTRYYLLLCLPAVVGMSVLARPVVELLAGASFHEGFRIIPFVAFGGLFLGLQQRFQTGLLFLKKTRHIAVAITVAGLANIGLNLLLVPSYGYMAAAVTTLVGYIILLAIMVIASRKYFVWDFPFRSLGRAVLASSIMAAAVGPVGNRLTSFPLANLAVAIPLGVVLYSAALWLLGEVQPSEKTLLKKTIARSLPSWLTPCAWRRLP